MNKEVQKCQVLTEQVRWARAREPAAALAIVDPTPVQDLSAVLDSSEVLGVVAETGVLMAVDLDMDVGLGFGAKAIIREFIHE
jgi:hypothetical protein